MTKSFEKHLVCVKCFKQVLSPLYVAFIFIYMLSFSVYGDQAKNNKFPLPPLHDRLSKQGDLLSMSRLYVSDIHFEGNAVFSDKELSSITNDYRNRFITSEELQQAAAKITRYYVANGYVNSGALLPDQDISSGVVTIQIVEGWVSRIELQDNEVFHSDYLVPRLKSAEPFNIKNLKKNIRMLQTNPVIQSINANLGAGLEKGEGILRVRVKESSSYEAGVTIDNRRSPGIGSVRGELWAIHKSLTGWNDPLIFRYSVNQGPDDYQIAYSRPVSDNDSIVSVSYEQSKSVVLEAPFDELDIESQFNRGLIAYRYPLINDLNRNLNLTISLEHHRSKTSLLGEAFSFSAGVVDGKSRTTSVNFTQEWVDRSLDAVFSILSEFKFGVSWFNSTINDSLPDSEFVIWTGRFQWVKRLNFLDSTAYLRAFVQRSNKSLLPEEKVHIGGMDTVRGYRESSLIRDQAALVSIEWRLPVKIFFDNSNSKSLDSRSVEMAFFYDYGEGRNKFLVTRDSENISSIGLGFLWNPTKNISATIYKGFNLREIDNQGEYDLQDDGIHFQFGLNFI